MKDKKKIIIPVVVAVIVIIAVVIIGITTLKKKAETTKIDIDTKSYVADLSKYIQTMVKIANRVENDIDYWKRFRNKKNIQIVKVLVFHQ